MADRFCCDVQLCNRTRRIVIITRNTNDVKMRGKINAGLSSFFFFFTFFDHLSSLTVSFTIKEGVQDWFRSFVRRVMITIRLVRLQS